ncbi:unnamed protein product [Rhizoctonia solani]|uniref:Uncharacterized protein n=1 Tax=Rhizoctonia solani TaxID=456999 RepID=A0A8H3GZ53_9AGAM|nr:unnamed protein product [Rhizoctonia solani]
MTLVPPTTCDLAIGCMAALAIPSCVERFGQRYRDHGITKPKSRLATHDLSTNPGSSHNSVREPHNTLSLTSNSSTSSQQSIQVHYLPKDQVLHCLEKYQALAREGLHFNSAKEAVLWCSLGLGVVACSRISPGKQTPFSGQCSGSIHPLNAISDSGFAPSFDTGGRNRLSADDPDMESAITNLVDGLAGVFTSGLLEFTSASHGLLPEVGQGFAPMLSRFGFARDQGVINVLSLAVEISTQLLLILQKSPGILGSSVSYWALCLKFVLSSSEDNASKLKDLQSQQMKCNPPHCLAEPTCFNIVTTPFQGNTLEFPTLSNSDPLPESPHTATPLHHRTRSRAVSLMSHMSLRSFSSIQSSGRLSAKSSATTSLSHDLWAVGSVLPFGSLIGGSPATALGTLGLLAESLEVIPQHRELLSPENEHSIATPGSSLKGTRLCSISDDLQKETGKGKAKATQLPREGLRPGTVNLRARTGTRFLETSLSAPSGLRSSCPFSKMDPLLAALEKNSKLKSKSRCLNCGKKGENVSFGIVCSLTLGL